MTYYKIHLLIWAFNHSGLIITIVTEFIIYKILIRRPLWQLIIFCILINVATQPLLNYLYYNFAFSLLLLEIAVVIVESVMIKFLFRLPYRDSLIISACANTVSYLSGEVIYFYLFPIIFRRI